MATKERVLKFAPSISKDVVEYKLFIEDSTEYLSYDSFNVSLGNPAPEADGYIHIKLNDIPELADKDGIYDLGVISIDDTDNPSSMAVINEVNLDFLAPEPPTDVSVS